MSESLTGKEYPLLPAGDSVKERLSEPQTGYSTHRDYMKSASPAADKRHELVRKCAAEAFAPFIRTLQCKVIHFADINAAELGRILARYPILAKPLMALCNVAERAIERDLGLKNLNSYSPRFQKDWAKALAGYLKPFLPERMELDGFCAVDRLMFLDKEIRKDKGRWERRVRDVLSQAAEAAGLKGGFKKRLFESQDEEYELDAAYPSEGPISIGVDVKRIEARRDIHKRCDEIVNKASKLKNAFPRAKFIAFIYYPFTEEYTNIASRLRSEYVDVVVFATESSDSIRNAATAALRTKTVHDDK